MAALIKGDHMRGTKFMRSAAPVAAALAALLIASGCGDVEVSSDSEKKSDTDQEKTPSAEPAAVDTSAGEGDWLLGMQSAGGADAEKSTTVYVTYNPSTGQATARKMPGVTAASRVSRGRGAAGERRPQVGDPRHRDQGRRDEQRQARGLLLELRRHQGRSTSASAVARAA